MVYEPCYFLVKSCVYRLLDFVFLYFLEFERMTIVYGDLNAGPVYIPASCPSIDATQKRD